MSDDPRDSDYVDENMAKALAHPVRVLILAEVNRKEILSPKQFADRHDKVLSNVSYHFRQLEKYECIELFEEKKARGAVEHVFKPKRRALFDGKSWDDLPQSVKEEMSADTFTNIINVVSDAMLAGTFDARNERFLVWKRTLLDEKAWQEIADIYREAVHKANAAHKRAKKRLKESGEPGVPSTWAFLFFQSPWMKPEQGDDSNKRD